ncbi:MAG: ATP-binding protein [Bacteroidota bacterium]|nr:ATP-binding protein [Bacteroidota bacterium]MDP4216387.1 ATP-binding protein [Bacteroidota bacterium]MDP4258979.1 ATP-binding protein [Bacteroidota bacterium]
MERTELAKLGEWARSKNRKPLVIRGARQTGKTWLMKELGRTEYEKVAYINFESSATLKSMFTGDFDIKRIILTLEIETKVTIEANTTLIILDEIQEAPGALTSLKYFQENAPEYHVIAAGSLLGVALNQHVSFPVGKVDFLDLHPLTFVEFLEALDEQPLVDLLKRQDWPLITQFRSRYIERLKQYYYIGGMPEAVYAFSQRTNFEEVRTIQRRILIAYEQDFSKHAPIQIVPRIRMLWNSVPAQLAKENRKFIYGMLRRGARAKDYELALSWLIDCGLIHKVNNVTKPSIPLKAYEDLGAFKLYLVDVGLLAAMVDLDVQSLISGNDLFEEFKGSLTEQYVLQQLITLRNASTYYWSPEHARAEVDFLLQIKGKVVPLEVKAAENLHAKSLRVYYQKYAPEIAIRTSLSDYRREEWMTNWPLYAIGEVAS